MAKKIKLDSVDRKILADLQDNGRMTNVELAARAGISAPPCLRRVRALEDSGVIRGYHADIDGDALGYTVMIFAFVGLTSQAETDLQDFEKMVGDWDMVRECHMLMGETDFLLKIVAYDWDDFQRFLTTKLTPAPNVSHVKTALSIRTRKIKPGVPVISEACTTQKLAHILINLIETTSYGCGPRGVCTSTESPSAFPIRARAIGDDVEIIRFSISAS